MRSLVQRANLDRKAPRALLVIATLGLVASGVWWISAREPTSRLAAGPSRGPGAQPSIAHSPPGIVSPGTPVSVAFRVTCPPIIPQATRATECAPDAVDVSYQRDGTPETEVPVELDRGTGTYQATLPPFEGRMRYTATVHDTRFALATSSWDVEAVAMQAVVIGRDVLQRAPSAREAVSRAWSSRGPDIDYSESVPVVPPAVERLAPGQLLVPDPTSDELDVVDETSGELVRRVPSPVPVAAIADIRALRRDTGAVAVLSQTGAGGVRLQRVDTATGGLGPSTTAPGMSAGRLVQAADGLHLLSYPGPVTRRITTAEDGSFRFGPPTQNLAIEQGEPGAGIRLSVTGDRARYCLHKDAAIQWCVQATSAWTFGDVPFVGQLGDGTALIVQRLYDDSGPGHPTRYFALQIQGGHVQGITPIDVSDEMEVPVGGRFRLEGQELRHLRPSSQALRVMAYRMEER